MKIAVLIAIIRTGWWMRYSSKECLPQKQKKREKGEEKEQVNSDLRLGYSFLPRREPSRK